MTRPRPSVPPVVAFGSHTTRTARMGLGGAPTAGRARPQRADCGAGATRAGVVETGVDADSPAGARVLLGVAHKGGN
ncbi:hypothetical protein HMPREF1550_00276 [Actinomyces sp. oral taxon 877 str. F0543]|nr:hypothetical protein HMPREF1550_00276 [Actinomyces sp. oral taxon 877 str. F0543]